VTGDLSRFVGSESGPRDLLVVGGGTAGIIGANTAALLGARVLLVERTGGDRLWIGCVPSKALLVAADVAASARGGHAIGSASLRGRRPTLSDPGVLRQRERPSRTP